MIQFKTEYVAAWDVPSQSWDKFVNEAFDPISAETNFKYPFAQLTKKFGMAFIEYCRAAWLANDNILSAEEFCTLNGNMPIGFFKGKVCK